MIENPHYEISVGPKGDKGDPGPAGTFTTPTADVSFGNHRITHLGTPRDGTDAVNKNYADSRYIRAGEQINLGSNRITHLNDPADNHDALNRRYADGRYLRSGQNINLGSNWITSSSTPSADNDLVNKAYVDSAISLSNMIVNKALTTPSVRFQHFIPNKVILFIWFNFSVGSSKISAMQPAHTGLNNPAKLYLGTNLSVEYNFDRTHITFTRKGNETLILDSIGYVYKI